MFIELFVLVVLAYMVILQERVTTCDIGHENSYFFRIDKCMEKKLRAPFKYRPLGFWLAHWFGVTTKNTESMEVFVDKYDYRAFILKSDAMDRYYIFKFLLLLFCASSFYFYLFSLGAPAFIGTILLYFFIMLTFIYDAFDYLIEIGLYSLFMVGVIQGWGFIFLGCIAFLANLNRESAVFMFPISVAYCSIPEMIFTFIGTVLGFIIPRMMYRAPADETDAHYTSGFKFLTFNPIRNWRHSIWPPLKARFKGMDSRAYICIKKRIMYLNGNSAPMVGFIKERFLNRIFFGISFLLLFYVLLFHAFGDMSSFYKPLAVIFAIFAAMISLPADIREIRVYAPTFLLIIPFLLTI